MAIVGTSFDAPEANATFKENNGFQFELWSDADRTLALYYGAASSEAQAMASRVTMVLDEEGGLVLEYGSVNPATHSQQVLKDCLALFGQ